MATGYMSAVDLLTATYQVVFVAPSSYTDFVTVSLCNRGAASTGVRLALTENTLTPSDAEFIEYGALLGATGAVGNVLERTGIAVADGEKIVAYSTLAGVSAVVYGAEK